jgi:hypothetical protein
MIFVVQNIYDDNSDRCLAFHNIKSYDEYVKFLYHHFKEKNSNRVCLLNIIEDNVRLFRVRYQHQSNSVIFDKTESGLYNIGNYFDMGMYHISPDHPSCYPKDYFWKLISDPSFIHPIEEGIYSIKYECDYACATINKRLIKISNEEATYQKMADNMSLVFKVD